MLSIYRSFGANRCVSVEMSEYYLNLSSLHRTIDKSQLDSQHSVTVGSIFLRKWNSYLGVRKNQINQSQFSKSVVYYFHEHGPPDRIPSADMAIFFVPLDKRQCVKVKKRWFLPRCLQFLILTVQYQARCAVTAFISSRHTGLDAR